MRKLLFAGGLGMVLILLSACGDKCQTCTYTISGQTITSQEVCGDKSILDENEAAIKAQVGDGVDVDCTRN